ncbi:MAG TPA: hypothetical protein VFB38_07530 [Chthonomonadaceae bacterium]|nr:hypothetical protein [Chthonomonadaceae bacterium]
MRVNALRGVVAGLGLLWAAGAAQAAGIPWTNSLSAAMTQAKQSHKLIMLDFYADW